MKRTFLLVVSLAFMFGCGHPMTPSEPDFIVGDPAMGAEIKIFSVDDMQMAGTATNIDVREVRVAVWRDGAVFELPTNSLGVVNPDGTWNYPTRGFRQAVAMLVDPDGYQRCSLEIEGVPQDPGVLAWEAYPPLE